MILYVGVSHILIQNRLVLRYIELPNGGATKTSGALVFVACVHGVGVLKHLVCGLAMVCTSLGVTQNDK